VVSLEIAGLFLFDGFLNIKYEFISSAKFTYQCVILMVVCTCLAAPFRGLLISHENLVYTSIVDVIDGILKLIIAYGILYINFMSDSLREYALLITSVSVFNLAAFLIYSLLKYPECGFPKIQEWSVDIVKKMTSFAGWVVYSTLMIVGRNQGTTIVLNRFFGTVINASFGIAIQINSACMFISGSILNAFNPQIIKSEGEGNRETAMKYAMIASKLCFLMMLMAVLPFCFYTNKILGLWLDSVPPYAVTFSQVVVITTLSDQITTGLSVINKAIGKLRVYALVVDTTKILTIPIIAILLYYGISLKVAIMSYLIMELVSALIRLPVLRFQASISVSEWIREVLLRLVIPTLIGYLYYKIFSEIFNNGIVSISMITLFGCILISSCSFLFALSSSERQAVKELAKPLLKKLRA